jgi:hypothetical protein
MTLFRRLPPSFPRILPGKDGGSRFEFIFYHGILALFLRTVAAMPATRAFRAPTLAQRVLSTLDTKAFSSRQRFRHLAARQIVHACDRRSRDIHALRAFLLRHMQIIQQTNHLKLVHTQHNFLHIPVRPALWVKTRILRQRTDTAAFYRSCHVIFSPFPSVSFSSACILCHRPNVSRPLRQHIYSLNCVQRSTKSAFRQAIERPLNYRVQTLTISEERVKIGKADLAEVVEWQTPGT